MALVNCPHCEKTISDRATLCPHCGQELNFKKEEPVAEVIVLCEECGERIADGALVCSNCGCPAPVKEEEPQETPQQVEIASVKIPKFNGNVKKYALWGVSILAVIILAVFIITSQSKNSYIGKLESVSITMLNGASEAESACNLIRSVWYNSIYEEYDSKTDKYTRPNGYFYDDFNDALGELFSDPVFLASLVSIENNQDTVKEMMKELNNPPEEYRDAYEALKDYYSAYLDLTNLAVDPTGNLNSYTQSFNTADTEVVRCYETMDMYFD